MSRRLMIAVVSVGLLSIFGATASGRTFTPPRGLPLPPHADRAVCGIPSAVTIARCFARVVTPSAGGAPLATSTYQNGYAPTDLRSAYALTSDATSTVAIVDAYDNPNARSDLAAYRAQFALPPLCGGGVSSGCVNFSKVSQTGGSTQNIRGNTGWGEEIDLDIDMVSAICPHCDILLVEAKSNQFSDLGAAVNYAASVSGVVAISNSYGTSGEFSGETTSTYNGPYHHPGIAVTASSGDSGYGVSFPAASIDIVAVGGTSLSSASGGWSETVWSGAGSGCSAYFTRPSWQNSFVQPYIDLGSTCTTGRVVADVSAVADPNTGVAVYDSYGSTGGNNWYVFGGTSVSSPIIASVFALAHNVPNGASAATVPYAAGTTAFHDVTIGSNGRCTRGPKRSTSSANAFLCTAEAGYDGPTGRGTPNGTAGF